MPERPPTGRATPRADDEIARLYDRHAAGLYRYALLVLADHGLAEDAVQQVFARLLSSKASRPLDVPDHYLRRAVRNECYTLLRRRSPGTDQRPLLEVVAEAVDQDERLSIEAAIRELPAEQREVVALKVYEGLTFKEIGELTDARLNTVASRYRYAIEKLRAVLEAPARVKR